MDERFANLFGTEDDAQRATARDFVARYDQGLSHEHITDDEVRTLYQAVADRLSPTELEDLAAEAYGRLTPDERRELAHVMQGQGGSMATTSLSDDPRELARITSQLHAQNSRDLAALLGSAVMESRDEGAVGSQVRGQGGGVGELVQNSVVRAALGGIVATAMRKVLR